MHLKMTQKTLISFVLYLITCSLCYAQWQQIGSDIDGEFAGDASGRYVSLSANGTSVAVGAPSNSNGQGSSFFGHVRVFELNSGNWVQKDNDIDGEAIGDFSGNPVQINADGSVVAIGAFNNEGNGRNAGHVRVFEFNSGNWIQKGSDIDGEFAEDKSGSALALNNNGNIVAIGAALNNGNGVASGHVRIFEFINGSWVQIGSDIDGENQFDNSGASVSLNSTGNIVAIGAPRNGGNGTNAGHVRVYEFTGGNWIQKGTDIDGETVGDLSGESISLNENGTVIAIGAIDNDGNGINQVGHVRVYEFNDTDWSQKGNDIDGEFEGDLSGGAVDLNGDGNIVAIGANANDGNGSLSGHVRVFQFSNGNWVQIDSDIDGENALDRFGTSVSISHDGGTVAIGAPANAGNGQNAGHVRVFNNASVLSASTISFLDDDISFYPNPTYGKINIQSKKSIPITSINLIDIQGRILETHNLNCSSCLVDMSNKGFYYLKLNTTRGTVVKKIIIK